MDITCQSKACGKPFNQATREPLMMSCCGETVCRDCISIMISPQEETYKCPCCQKENRCDTSPAPNQMLKRLLSKLQQVCIYCEDHDDLRAEYYCKDHKRMICTNCALKINGDHQGNCVQLNCKEFDAFCHTILQNLKEEHKRISTMIDSLMSYLDQERVFPSKEFLTLIKDSLSSVASKVKDKEQQNILDYLGDINAVDKQIENIDLIVQQSLPQLQQPLLQQQQEQLQQVEQLLIDSKILKPAVDMPLIKGWLSNLPNLKFDLLFRGSRDGFTAAAFHQRCDNQGPTLHIVQSEHNKVFGGYALVSQRSTSQSAYDDKAFLFSITHKTKHNQYSNQHCAVRHFPDSLSAFGYGTDLLIKDNCNQNNSSFSTFGWTYEPPNGMKDRSDEDYKYLAGSHYFRVDEMEVFKVITQ